MKNKSLEMLDQIIDLAEKVDLKYKKECILKSKASQSVGESWLLFNLKSLRELITLENKDATSGNHRPIQEKE